MKALIVLGCEGHQQDGFHFCNGVENTILDLEKIERAERYFDIIKYLDANIKIFDHPCNKSHVVSNAIYKMYEMEFIPEKLYQFISHFYEVHRRCGLILYAKVKD